MTDDRDARSTLDALEARIRAARGRDRSAATPADGADDGPSRGAGMGLGLRIGVEMVVTVAVGCGIGYLLDRWLGTAPILMVVFLFLGAAAGVSNVYRVVRGLDDAVGLGRAIEAKERQESARRPDPAARADDGGGTPGGGAPRT